MSKPIPIQSYSHPRTAREVGIRAPWWGELDLPHTPFRVVTADGVELRGVHLKRGSDTLLIYCHGFLSGKNYIHSRRWMSLLGEAMDVIGFDFRGHGESGGETTFGDKERYDLDAVMRYARRARYRRLVVMGSSMGGAVAIRCAAESADVDGVITLGAFAHPRLSVWARGGLRLLHVPLSRSLMCRAYCTRIARAVPPYAPSDYVGKISPRPLLVIHGALDPLIPVAHARQLYACAGAPKELRIIPFGGHDSSNLNPGTRDFIVRWIAEHRG